MTCELRTLLFTEQPVRAQLTQLTNSWRRIIENHNYPPAVQNMLGELVAASLVLSASLKFNGSLILQIKGDGPVKLVVAECNNELGIRATAMVDKSLDIPADADFKSLVNVGGKGRFVIILDPKDRLPGQQPYQGIIEITGNSIAQAIEGYMAQSEQLQTRLWLQADAQIAAGLLLQQMPSTGGMASVQTAQPESTRIQEDTQSAWERLLMLSDTLKAQELLEHTSEVIAKRLFWQEPHEILAVRHPNFHCTCSREKVARMLKSLGEAEITEAVEEQTVLSVNCDYCNSKYEFDAVDCAALFIATLSNGAADIPDKDNLH
jgi:molecular chaperone Hsp33